jgi:hypothetical protein
VKKDPNYIASLEKAIKEKYGDLAVANPSSRWDEAKEQEYISQLKSFKHYPNDGSDKKEVDGFFATKRLINKEQDNICPVCDKLSLSKPDSLYLLKYDCCQKCYIKWVEDREERWNSGWRPKKYG